MPSATPNALENMSRLQPLRLLDPSAHFDRIEATRYRRRALIWELALKKLKLRYKRLVLGFLRALLNPAHMMVVLTIVFSTILRFGIPHYAIFLLSVLLPWTFFSQSIGYGVDCIVSNG